MKLKVYIENPNLRMYYMNTIDKHNEETKSRFPDSGFDLFCHEPITIRGRGTYKIDLGIQCAAYNDDTPSPFYLYPRSSISKTPLRLSNNVGIIDSGYRGNLGAFVDNISDSSYDVEPGTRLFQICAPNLETIEVELVKQKEDLGKTLRGSGGFGSTGV